MSVLQGSACAVSLPRGVAPPSRAGPRFVHPTDGVKRPGPCTTRPAVQGFFQLPSATRGHRGAQILEGDLRTDMWGDSDSGIVGRARELAEIVAPSESEEAAS